MSLSFRRAVLTEAAGDAGLIALVDPAQIHPQAPLETPSFPFIRYGAPSETPRKAACAPKGALIAFAMHGFSQPLFNGSGVMIETAEDRCHKIATAIVDALDGKAITDEDGAKVRLRWDGTQIMPDGATPDAFHAVVNFTGRVLA